MKYIECTVFTSTAGLEPLNAMLLSMGIDGIALNDPCEIDGLLDKKNSYDWDYIDKSVLDLKHSEPSLTVYLENGPEGRRQLDAIKKGVGLFRVEGRSDMGRLEVEAKIVNDEDWKDNWKEYFKPTHITDRIVVKPTWENYTRLSENETVIEIDPGMAFGTGTHETTSCCIRLLEKYMKHGYRVLDVGSGSGILSIAASLLGASEVLGIEIDPEAVKVGRENVRLNGLEDRVNIVEGDLTKGVDFRADIAVANLMADLVKLLSRDVRGHLTEGGIYISSGILAELSEEVADVIRSCGFEIEEILFDGEWCAIAARGSEGENG